MLPVIQVNGLYVHIGAEVSIAEIVSGKPRPAISSLDRSDLMIAKADVGLPVTFGAWQNHGLCRFVAQSVCLARSV